MKKILSVILAICLSTSLFALNWSNPLEDVSFTHNEDCSEWQVELKGVNPEWYYKPTVVLSSDNECNFTVKQSFLLSYEVEEDKQTEKFENEFKADVLELISNTIRYRAPFVGISVYEYEDVRVATEIVSFILPNNNIMVAVELKEY